MAKKSKKRNTIKFKWTKELIILIVAIVAIIVATICMSVPSEASKKVAVYNDAIENYNNTNSTSYYTLPEDNVFQTIDYEGLKNIVAAKNEGYTYVLYGLLTEGTVLENLYTINGMAEANEISTVYFYSAEWVDGQDDLEATNFKKELKECETNLNAGKDADVEEFTLLEYPALVIYKDGKLVFNTQAYSTDDYSWSQFLNKLNFYNAKYDAEQAK